MTKGSTWNKWDFHLHTPYSILNNGFGDPNNEETWNNYIDRIETEAVDKKIVAIGITDYFMIEGYKKVIEYQKKGRLKNVFVFPNIEFRLDKVITVIKGEKSDSKRLNLHVIFSPDVRIEDIEDHFLHELNFIYEQDTFASGEKRKLKTRSLEEFGKNMKSQHADFKDKSDMYVGCLNAVIDSVEIKSTLENKSSIFKGKYLIVMAEENLSLMDWNSQSHGIRKQLLQMSHCLFSSNKNTKDFCLGLNNTSVENHLKEFKSLKPCIWGCDSHSFEERFLEPEKDSNGKTNNCWIKAEVTWEGLKQILYEPDERVQIQESCPEPQKSIYTIDKFEIKETKINESLMFSSTILDLNYNLIAIIGGRGSGKTAILDIIATCFKEGNKLKNNKNSFFYRLYGEKRTENQPISSALTTLSNEIFAKKIGLEDNYFEQSNILYLTQKHFDEFSSDYKKLNDYIFKLIFDKFPDEKNKYEHHETKIKTKISEIQAVNLKIQQLIEEIKIKSELNATLKHKQGEKLDYEKRIQEIEAKAKVSKEVSKIADQLNDSRNKKQKIESLLYRVDNFFQNINKFKEFAVLLKEFNQDLNIILKENPSKINYFPDDFFIFIENIEKIAFKNKQIFEEELPDIDANIAQAKKKLEEFQDVNKIISELREKSNLNSDEINKINKQIEEINKKEEVIRSLIDQRFVYYKDIIKTFVELKSFVAEIIVKFEGGKDKILNNLNFDVSIVLNEEYILMGIDERVNHKSISEEKIKSKLNEEIFLKIKEIINSDSYDFDNLFINLNEVGEFLFNQSKKSTTYSDFYDKLYQKPLEIQINIRLDQNPLENLSMGQRAIVLLKIILSYDDKPLLIDQPEEDLDNSYIYSQLVEAFKEAKKKRQIIIATHNANLVVNTDAEQIIVAKYIDNIITYTAGTLENPDTRFDVKDILEGGEKAFKKREEKYGFKF